jgi:2-dehydro-3-deoxygalactonokinase
MATALIAIDWGTSSARAWRLDARGDVLAEHAEPLGVQKVEGGRFHDALRSLLGGDPPAGVPLLACGMIGSRQGWLETPYVECPAGFASVASGLARVADAPLAIVPGLTCRDAQGVPDVMRGEETQIFGALDDPGARQLVVLPGTHSKWALVVGGAIERFATFMTGELYAVLREHSILGRLAVAGADGGAFERGLRASLGPDAGLSHDLFSARTLALTGGLAPDGVGDYLSGLLLGAELAAAQGWIARSGARGLSVTLVGEPALCARYDRALSIAGLAARKGPGDAAARGLWRIAQHAGLVR